MIESHRLTRRIWVSVTNDEVREKKRGLDIRQIEPGRQHEKIKLPISRSLPVTRPLFPQPASACTVAPYAGLFDNSSLRCYAHLSLVLWWLAPSSWMASSILSPPTCVIGDKFWDDGRDYTGRASWPDVIGKWVHGGVVGRLGLLWINGE